MALRVLTLLAIAVSCSCQFSTPHQAQTELPNYRLELKTTGSQKSEPVVMSCVENRLCQGEIQLPIYEKSQALMVEALFQKGTVHLKFTVEKTHIFIDSLPYISMPLGPSHVDRWTVIRTLHLNEPPPSYLEDSRGGLLRQVLRVGPFLATIDIDIQPFT